MRLMRQHAPHVQWVVSFADGAQCGDGTIYRASGFLLTGIRKNTSLWAAPDGHVSDDVSVKAGNPNRRVFSRTSLTDGSSKQQQQQAQQWQQHLMELQAMLQQRLYKSQQPSMWSQLAGIGGTALGAFFGGPAGAAIGGNIGNQAGNMFGGGSGGMDMNDWLQNGGMNYGGFR